MDLTKSYPRSMRDKIAGVVMAARLVDKAKAAAYGKIGEYSLDRPMDEAIFAFLGIDAAQLVERVAIAKDDGEIESYVRSRLASKSPAEIESFNENYLQLKPVPGSENEKSFLALRGEVAPHRTDVTVWADLIDLDEKREVPWRTGDR